MGPPLPQCDAGRTARCAAKFFDPAFSTGSNCPSWFWLYDYMEEASGPFVAVDVGCNRGFTSAKLFGTMAPELGVTPETAYAFGSVAFSGIEWLPRDYGCGACGDCTERPRPAGARPVTVHCVEASDNHYARLVATKNALMRDGNGSHAWHLHRIAMTDAPRTAVRFKDDGCGELCAIGLPGATSVVLAMNVDALVESLNVRRAALLKVDTEGNDPAVLAGARQSLKDGVFDMVTFEHHEVGLWSSTQLLDVVTSLAKHEYACFYDGKDQLFRLTGCYNARWNEKRWTNVVCVHARMKRTTAAMLEKTC